MEKLTLDVPAMYGDHHVIDVRTILLKLPGVTDVYASSAFHVVEVSYDPAQTDAKAITAQLDEAGYLHQLETPLETGKAAYKTEESTYFRHTAAYAQTGQTVSFAQNVNYAGRPLWPCPGMGPVSMSDEGE